MNQNPSLKNTETTKIIRKKSIVTYARVSTYEINQLYSHQNQIEEFITRIKKNDE